MKKRLFTLIALVMAVIMGLAAFSGCNLVTSDNDRDMAQVVATVNIGNDGAKAEEITKKQLIMSYLNYAYSIYNSNSNYSTAEIFDLLLNQLINSRIMVQYIMGEYENDPTVAKRDDKAKWDVERYLTADEMVDAEYTAIKAMNDLIDSYEKKDDEYADTDTQTARTVPTGAENAEEELDTAAKQEYIEEGILIGEEGSPRRKAYNDVLKLLKNNGLLGKDFKDDLKTSDYYKETLKSAEENALVDRYEEEYTRDVRENLGYAQLCAKYEAMYDKQVADYTASKSDFESALSSATASSPVVYYPYDGYGYVYNLLIGVDDNQKAEISALNSKETDKTARAVKRATILKGVTAVDQRSTWIEAGYDFDFDTSSFTGDYTFYAEEPFTFKGEVDLLREKTDKEDAQYKATGARFSLDELITVIDEYLYGEEQEPLKPNKEDDGYTFSSSVYRAVSVNDKPAGYDKKINELLFAFSTDGGSLNTFLGYSITPAPDAGGSETYMQEFADAGRLIVSGKDAIDGNSLIVKKDKDYDIEDLDFSIGKGGYMVVATDYGYHFMFYSQSFAAGSGFATLEEYLNFMGYEKGAESWQEEYEYMLENYKDYDEKSFLYIFANQCSDADNALSKNRTEILKKYKYDARYVVKYADRYADLGSN